MPVVVLLFLWFAFLGVIRMGNPSHDDRSRVLLVSGAFNDYLEDARFATVVNVATCRNDFEIAVAGYVASGAHIRTLRVDLPDPMEVQTFLSVHPGNVTVLPNANAALVGSKVDNPIAQSLSLGHDVYRVPSRLAAKSIPKVLRLMGEESSDRLY
jgi:hypothetical protein